MKNYRLKLAGKQCGNRSAYVWENKNYAILQSYATVVSFINKKTNKVYIRDYYSVTTTRHINAFLQKFNLPKIMSKDYSKFKYPRKWDKIESMRSK